jgi:hypothetical protein
LITQTYHTGFVCVSLEFENAETLLNSEVFMLLEHRKGQGDGMDDEQDLSQVFMKTLNYTQKFSRYKNRETIASVRRLVVCFKYKTQEYTMKYMFIHGL